MPSAIQDSLIALLSEAGEAGDDEMDVGAVALALGALDRPGIGLDHYVEHLDRLAEECASAVAALGPEPSPSMVAGALAGIISGRFSYRGDVDTYDDMQNADLTRVIERRLGLPVALGILYLHAARRSGLDLVGLNFPGHFVLRLTSGGDAAIIDPFNAGQLMDAAALRRLLQALSGEEEMALTPDTYAPLSGRDVVLRLQNNILGRAAQAGEFERAREILERMILIAPRRAELRYELGRIALHAGELAVALDDFTTCVDVAEAQAEIEIAESAKVAIARLRDRLQ